MRKFALAAGIAIAAMIAATSCAPQTRQEHRRMNWAENLPEAVRTFHSKRFTIVSFRTAVEVGSLPTPGSEQQVEAIRSAIRANKWLLEQLKVKKLTPNDIEWAGRTANGNMIFYIE